MKFAKAQFLFNHEMYFSSGHLKYQIPGYTSRLNSLLFTKCKIKLLSDRNTYKSKIKLPGVLRHCKNGKAVFLLNT